MIAFRGPHINVDIKQRSMALIKRNESLICMFILSGFNGRFYTLGHRSPELKKNIGKAHEAFALFGAMIVRDALSGVFMIYITIFLDYLSNFS